MTRSLFTRTRHRSLVAAALTVAALIAAPHASAAPKAAPSAAPVVGLEGVAHFDHIVVLTEENASAKNTFASDSKAVYLRSLAKQGVFLPNYYGTSHVSLGNYIAMVSGQVPNPTNTTDCLGLSLWTCVQPQTAQDGGRNLADQLEEAKLDWRSYQDGTTTPCFHATYSATDPSPDLYQGNSTTGAKNYADRHNPFIYFANVIGDQPRCDAHQRPFTDLATDLKNNALPAFSFITPDTCNDGHDSPCAGQTAGGLTTVDAFAKQHLPALIDYLNKNNGLLIINFDEGGYPSSAAEATTTSTDYYCAGCAGGGIGGRTGAILVSSRLKGGTTDAHPYDHYSLLRTIEDSFGISEHLGRADEADAFVTAFAGIRRAH